MTILKQKTYWVEHYRDEKYEVIRQNILQSFKDLVFDELPHKYYLNGVELDCVSNITHLFKPHFDTDRMARETFERNFNNENSKYYRMTVQQIKESWKKTSDDACELGSARHNFGESVFWWMVGEYDKIVPEFIDRFTVDENGDRICTPQFPKEEAIVRFWSDLPECYIPILAENKVFNVNENYAYSGTFDILFYYDAPLNGKPDSQSGAYIMDYKTNKDLYKNFKEQKLLHPFEELLDMPLSIYKLQLAAYQLCLEKINIPIIMRCLIWLRPNGEYEKIRLEDLSKRLNKALIEKFKK